MLARLIQFGPMIPTGVLRRRACVLVVLLSVAGCSNGNVALNDPHVALANRKLNQTRAAIFTQKPPADADGYFVGLSLSGGGSRSASFSAACMFQLERLGILQ